MGRAENDRKWKGPHPARSEESWKEWANGINSRQTLSRVFSLIVSSFRILKTIKPSIPQISASEFQSLLYASVRDRTANCRSDSKSEAPNRPFSDRRNLLDLGACQKTSQSKQKNQITQPSPSHRLSNTRSFSAAHDCKETSSSAAAHPQLPALRRESREPLSQALYPASGIILCSIQPTTNSVVNFPSSPPASTV
jgi:hypothetical protein